MSKRNYKFSGLYFKKKKNLSNHYHILHKLSFSSPRFFQIKLNQLPCTKFEYEKPKFKQKGKKNNLITFYVFKTNRDILVMIN